MILVDTSVWIEVFRRKNPLDLAALVAFEDVVTALPIVTEVLQGFRDEAAYRLARGAMFNLPIVESPLSQQVFEDAIDLYRTARRKGLTVRSTIDCVIAACALRNDLEVLHKDRDFPAIASISRLRERRISTKTIS